ncbi:putative flippase GtrA [Duganella sp. 1411]|jgi:putative flippase GtrA|uniref:GtrA family protein n=1 Tax=Duganella sp. 1411 TaxID=2806572 RepID=UPI001AE37020|nr:GtrA family protein [Duganella sp. 1411]MBP1206771.1 putative flippase GtrA [Duganella sp. 1411]
MFRRTFLTRQFLLYVGGGVLSALVDVGLMRLLLGAGAGLWTATSCGFVAGLMVNYAYHARLTFGHGGSGGALARYLCVVAGNYLLTLACVGAAQALASLPLAGKLLALPLVAAVGYVAGKHWIFKPQ